MEQNELIANSPNKDFFTLLLSYQNPKAAELALEKLKNEDLSKGYMMLKAWLRIGDYAKTADLGKMDLDFSKDYALEIAEFGRLIDILVSNLKHYETATALGRFLSEQLTNAAIHIENAARGYGEGVSIPANVWIEGAAVRDWALFMANYFEDRKMYQEETQMRFVRCKITNSIMNHYMHLVGPDMVGVGKALERLNLPDRAFQFYHAVRLDFAWLFDKHKQNMDLGVEDKLSLWALREAYMGILRLGKSDAPEQDEMRVMLLEAMI